MKEFIKTFLRNIGLGFGVVIFIVLAIMCVLGVLAGVSQLSAGNGIQWYFVASIAVGTVLIALCETIDEL